MALSFGIIAQRGSDECGDKLGVVDHVKSFGEVVRSGGQGWLQPWLYYVQGGGGRKRWSGWDGSHVGWVKEEMS